MLNRKIDNEIDVHFSNSKKALFLTGARQVGKTYSIRKYAKRKPPVTPVLHKSDF